MEKIARNGPCRCGSGKKYKKCCGAAASREYVTDGVSAHVRELFLQNVDEIRRRFKAASDQLATARSSLVKRDNSEDAPGTQRRLESYAAELEGSIRTVLLRHSPIFWISLERRFPPWLLLPSIDALPGFEVQMLRELHQIETALLLKHGSWEHRDWQPSADGTLHLDPDVNDIADLFGHLRPYFNELMGVVIVYRRVGMGGKLALNAEGALDAVLEDSSERAVQLYQERRAKFAFTLSPLGVSVGFPTADAPFPEAFRSNNHAVLMLDFNINSKFDVRLPGASAWIREPAFKPRVLLLREIFEFLEPFEEKVVSMTSLGLHELRLGFAALKNYLIDTFNGPAAYTYFSRGLALTERYWMFERLCTEVERLSSKETRRIDVKGVVSRFLDLLTWNMTNAANYDLFLRRGGGCLITQGELFMIDLTFMIYTFGDLLLDLQLDSETRHIKGSHFENKVAKQIAIDIPEVELPIKPGLRLKRKSVPGVFAQADLYIRAGRFLLLVDCKSYAVTRDFLKGDFRAVRNRCIEIGRWLAENDARAALLARVSDPANYVIPVGVTHIVPLVCSAFPEYMSDLSDAMCLSIRYGSNTTARVPRVCTYPELIYVIQNIDEVDLDNKGFVIPLRSAASG